MHVHVGVLRVLIGGDLRVNVRLRLGDVVRVRLRLRLNLNLKLRMGLWVRGEHEQMLGD
jgi:hypothetical protein